MEIIRQQNFNLEFFEVKNDSAILRVGVANYKNNGPGCEMFYPESGSDYLLIVYDNGWYKFQQKEFTHTAGLEYISKKLKCSEEEARVIHELVQNLLRNDAAINLLANKDGSHFKNPYLPGWSH